MRSSFKKTIAILLAVVLAFSVMTVGVVGASAEDGKLQVTVSSSVPKFFPTSTQYVDQKADKLTVTYWFNLEDYSMVNNQWQLTYDPSVLQYDTEDGVNQTVSNNKTTYLVYKFPENKLGSMQFNPVCEQNVMKGNITHANGFECYGQKYPFLSITFDIIDHAASETSVYLDMQVMQVRHKDILPEETPVDFINHSAIVNSEVPFTTDESYTAAYEGDYNPDYTTGPVHLDNFKISAVNLSLGSNIAIQAKVSPETVADYDSYWLHASAKGKDEIDMEIDHYDDSNGRAVFVYDKIFANEMYKEVTFVLHAKKGDVEYYGDPSVTSIKKYSYGLLARNLDEKMKTLVVDLLNYGAAAQTYHPIEGETTELVNAQLTEEQKACATTNSVCTDKNKTDHVTIENPTVAVTSGRCALGSSITPIISFENKFGMDGVTVRAEMNGKVYTVDSFEEAANGKPNQYQFRFDKVYSNRLDTEILFTVMKNGQPISNTYRYDVESYAAKVQTSTASSEADKKMVNAMVCYGRGAKACYPK